MDTEREAPPAARYDDDFVEWTVAQAAAIRARRWADIDVENLAEEIDALGRSNKREIGSRLRVMIEHILKRQYQPEHQSRSWPVTILTQSAAINDLLDDSPSLRRFIPEAIASKYRSARRLAAEETGLPLQRFPEELPEEIVRAVDDALADAASLREGR